MFIFIRNKTIKVLIFKFMYIKKLIFFLNSLYNFLNNIIIKKIGDKN